MARVIAPVAFAFLDLKIRLNLSISYSKYVEFRIKRYVISTNSGRE